MSILDQALSQFAGHDLASLAAKVGVTPQQAESAVAALGYALPEPGDTAGLAAARTGLPVEVIQQLLGHLGGEAGLNRIAGALSQGGGIGAVLSGMFSRG